MTYASSMDLDTSLADWFNEDLWDGIKSKILHLKRGLSYNLVLTCIDFWFLLSKLLKQTLIKTNKKFFFYIFVVIWWMTVKQSSRFEQAVILFIFSVLWHISISEKLLDDSW